MEGMAGRRIQGRRPARRGGSRACLVLLALLGLLGLLGAGWGGLALLGRLYRLDGDPPADADLLPGPRAALPEEENGFAVLAALPFPARWPPAASAREMKEMAAGRAWDPALAREALALNGELLEGLEACLARPGLRFPPFEEKERFRVSPLLDLAHLAGFRLRLLEEEGRPAEAVEAAMRLLDLGHRVAGGAETYLELTAGLGIKLQGLEHLERLLAGGAIDPWSAGEAPPASWLPAKNALGERLLAMIGGMTGSWPETVERERLRLAQLRAALAAAAEGGR